MRVRPEDLRRPLTDAPIRRLRAEALTLLLTFVPHENNDHSRKAVTILAVGVWAALEVGHAFRFADLPNSFLYFRIAVLVLVMKAWGIEINNFAGVEFNHMPDTSDDEKEEGDADE